jgi:hypothetical protein
MSRLITQSITLSAAVGNAVCASQTPSGAGALTINGASATGGVYTAPSNTPRHLSITTAADESAKTFTITGTDRNGAAMTFATAGAASATTTVYPVAFNTITSVTVSAATAGAITVGYAAAAHTGWIPLDRYASEVVGIQAKLTTGASLTFTLQSTMDDVQADGFYEQFALATNSSTVTGTASAIYTIDTAATAIRFLVNSWSMGGVTFTVSQRP